MLRRMMIPAVLLLCAFPLRAQVEARQATPEEVKKTAPATQTEVPSPMLLEVPLAGPTGSTSRRTGPASSKTRPPMSAIR